VPPIVREQAAPILRGLGKARIVTIGPQFDPLEPTSRIATQFGASLDALVLLGIVDGRSPAVAEAMRELKRHREFTAEAFADLDRDVGGEWWTPPIVLRETPGEGFESELIDALKVALEQER